jgi:hypothetical protein
MDYDEPAAYRVARNLLEGASLKNNESQLYIMSHRLVYPGLELKTPDWDLALALSTQLNKIAPDPNPAYLWTLAEANAGRHDYAKAVEIMQSLFPIVDSHPAIRGDRGFYEGRLKAIQEAQKQAMGSAKAGN